MTKSIIADICAALDHKKLKNNRYHNSLSKILRLTQYAIFLLGRC